MIQELKMGTAKLVRLSVIISAIVLTAAVAPLFSYDLPIHAAIAGKAVNVSSLPLYLESQLGFGQGTQETILGQTVEQWIILGARLEDIPATRVRHHFHNPLRPWTQAGLTFGIRLGESSTLWNQEPSHDGYLLAGTGSWSWHNARQQYLESLGGSTKAQREKSLADLFRSLGQGTHLLQDATVPAHVREDPHLNVIIPFLGFHFPNPAGYETWVLNNQGTVNAIIGLAPKAPALSIFSVTGNSRAPSPVARLFDTDLFEAGNSGILSDPALGITEFTNGNFLSRSTIFRDFTLPRAVDLALEQGVDEIIDGRVERYFSRPLPTGETVTRFVREGMLRRSLRAFNLSPGISSSWVLDDRVHADYARFLLPRAVGYSASLIDYFFRGKLNVDVSNDPTDMSLVRVEGTNGSTEKLDGGTLELYSEDSNGTRIAATPVGTNTVTANPGQPISATFRLPANSDKLMAVYKGKLGDEAPEGDFPGAVIGKSLSPQRVEQIFSDSTRWYIRNSSGVFPLPLLKSDVDDLQWGDRDNTLVGRSRIGPGQPNLFYTYRINRLVGATHIPLAANNAVDIQSLQQYSFPMGVDIGTNAQFSHTLPYKQHLLWKQIKSVQTWVPTEVGNPTAGFYTFGPSEVTYGISLLVDEIRSTSLNYPLLLDESSHAFGSGASQYNWNIWSIHLTADGRPLALVQINFTTNNLGIATFSSRTLGAGGSGSAGPSIIELPSVQVPFALPELGPIWALVDVTTGQILANTAPLNLVMNHTNGRTVYHPNPTSATVTYRVLSTTQYVGGPQDGAITPWTADDFPTSSVHNHNFCTVERLNAMDVFASRSVTPAHIQTQLTQNRAEIAQLEFASAPSSSGSLLNFPVDCGDALNPAQGFRIVVAPGPMFAPNNIGEFGAGVLRTSPVAGTEKLVFLMSQAQSDSVSSQRTKLIGWNPELSRIDAVKEFTNEGLHVLTTASRDAALFLTLGTNNNSRLVDFSTESVTLLPNQLLFDYALLDPSYFYNTSEFKFHSKDTSLASTGTPVSLAPALSGNPRGRYHLLRIGGGPLN
jgi:hypothetical protein